MENEPTEPQELNPEQLQVADFFIDQCDLHDFADRNLNMMGQSGTVRFGLGRCSAYIIDMTPDEIRDMVMTQLAQQDALTADK